VGREGSYSERRSPQSCFGLASRLCRDNLQGVFLVFLSVIGREAGTPKMYSHRHHFTRSLSHEFIESHPVPER
jgi:hypothetical protein